MKLLFTVGYVNQAINILYLTSINLVFHFNRTKRDNYNTKFVFDADSKD